MQISSGTKWKTTTFNFSWNAQGDFIQVSLKYIDYIVIVIDCVCVCVFHLHKGASFLAKTNAHKNQCLCMDNFQRHHEHTHTEQQRCGW